VPDAWLDPPFRAEGLSGAEPGSGSPVRVRIDGYACHLAQPVARVDLRRLVASFAGRGRWRAVPVGGHALSGRSAIWRHEIPGIGTVVVKEYRRGGMLRFIRRRYYVRFGPTRPEREFRNLRAAREAGLNVPEPVVSVSRGMLVYRGWLVTRLIVGRSLVDVVRSGTDGVPELLDDLARQVGLLIDRRVAHVDLHPGNVLVDDAGTVYLLDFDRAFAFDKPIDELRQRYEVRWRRAVEKHGLPAILADGFSEGLTRLSLPTG
jgi:hypothetical protein